MNSTVKTVAFWLVILLSGVLLWQVVKAGGGGAKEQPTTFSKFMADVNHGDVSKVTISGTDVHGNYKSGSAGFHLVPTSPPIVTSEDELIVSSRRPSRSPYRRPSTPSSTRTVRRGAAAR